MKAIKKYFTLTYEQEQKFLALKGIYEDWNSRINVISRKDIDNFYERHVMHSLGIAKVIQFKENTHIMDVGTGGGFPGIPLAIMFSQCKFLLVDSIGKKIKVVNAVINEIKLYNVEAIQQRAENIKEKFDFVVSRAVTDLPVFYNLVNNNIKKQNFNNIPNGILYLKGGLVLHELLKIKCQYKIFELKDYFEEEFYETKKVVHLY